MYEPGGRGSIFIPIAFTSALPRRQRSSDRFIPGGVYLLGLFSEVSRTHHKSWTVSDLRVFSSLKLDTQPQDIVVIVLPDGVPPSLGRLIVPQNVHAFLVDLTRPAGEPLGKVHPTWPPLFNRPHDWPGPPETYRMPELDPNVHNIVGI